MRYYDTAIQNPLFFMPLALPAGRPYIAGEPELAIYPEVRYGLCPMPVYLPLEIKHRELPSRLLIAAHVLADGKPVVIGNHWSMTDEANLAALPPGAFLFKTCNKIQGSVMTDAKAAGHFVAATDEEVLVFNEDTGFTLAFSDAAADALDLFFAQDNNHKAALTHRFQTLRVEVVGNVRADLMRMKGGDALAQTDPRISALQPYVLFNMNYASINSIWNDGNTLNIGVAEETGAFDGPDREARKKVFFDTVEWERGNHDAMLELLGWAVRSIKGLRFVIRPHPGERPDYWRQISASATNTVVITDSDPHPWIAHAVLVVHTGCTTGLEATLMKRPVLNLLPVTRPHVGQVTDVVNPVFQTAAAAAEAIVAFLGGAGGAIANHRYDLAKLFPGAGTGQAAKRIAARLCTAARENGAWRGSFADIVRTERQRTKFTVSGAEIREGLSKAAALAKVNPGRWQVSSLGDSLFQVLPR